MKTFGMVAMATAVMLAFSGSAFAQDMPGPGDKAKLPMANPHPMNAADVDPAIPFGEIDIAAAGNTRDTIVVFAEGMTEEQKTELTSRCHVIVATSANFQPEAVGFCGTWIELMLADPGASPLPGLGGDAPAGVPLLPPA